MPKDFVYIGEPAARTESRAPSRNGSAMFTA